MAILKADGSIKDHQVAAPPFGVPSMPTSAVLPANATVNAAGNAAYYQPFPAGQFNVPPPPLPNAVASGAAVAAAAIQMKQTEARLASIVAQSVHNPTGILGYPPVQQASSTVGKTVAGFPAPARPFNAATAATTQYRKKVLCTTSS